MKKSHNFFTHNNSRLTEAQLYLQQGKLHEAEKLIRDIRASEPGNIDALILDAILLFQQDQFDLSEKLFRMAISFQPGNPVFHCHLALVLTKKSMRPEAIAEYQHAISIDKNFVQAYYNLGILLREEQFYDAAIDAFKIAIKLRPDFALAYNGLGNVFRDSGDSDNALINYRKAIALSPGHLNAHTQLGILLYKTGSYEEAEGHLRHAISANPEYPGIAYMLGCLMLKKKQAKEAEELLSQAVELDSGNADMYAALGSALRLQGRYEEAASTYKKALSINQLDPDLLFSLGLTLQDLRNQSGASIQFRRALEIKPDHIKSMIGLGCALVLMDRPSEALDYCQKVLSIEPENVDAISLISRIATYSGDTEKAWEYIEPLINKGSRVPNLILAFSGICKKLNRQTQAITLLEDLIQSGLPCSSNLLRSANFTLGNLYDDIDEYDKAFKFFKNGNDLANMEFDSHKHLQSIHTLIHNHNSKTSRHTSNVGSDRPIFIVGMPRSGTTLVEQILAAHSKIHGGGELLAIPNMVDNLQAMTGTGKPYPFCLDELTETTLNQLTERYLIKLNNISKEARHVTDKLPGNFLNLGFIEKLFPNARIIHCRRNPIDTCLSCYFQDFSGNHPYSYSLDGLAHFYTGYMMLMDHWRNYLTIPMLEIDYEDLIFNLEENCHRLIDFCNVGWEPACVEFYNTRRFVGTASYDQVSKPIYTKSVGRWVNYKKHLTTLLDILEDINE